MNNKKLAERIIDFIDGMDTNWIDIKDGVLEMGKTYFYHNWNERKYLKLYISLDDLINPEFDLEKWEKTEKAAGEEKWKIEEVEIW